MPVSSHSVLQALDAKEAALAFLLKKGNKRVLWDSCELIWDPYELLGQRAKTPNQVSRYMLFPISKANTANCDPARRLRRDGHHRVPGEQTLQLPAPV